MMSGAACDLIQRMNETLHIDDAKSSGGRFFRVNVELAPLRQNRLSQAHGDIRYAYSVK
jgi:putative lipoic acid-binding regulatory protein